MKSGKAGKAAVKTLNVRIEAAVFRRFKAECAKRGLKIQAAAEQAIRAWLRSGGG